MLRLFTSNRPIVILLLPILIATYQGVHLITQGITYGRQINLGFYGTIEINPILGVALSLIFVFLNAFLINFIFNRNEFWDRNMYMPSLLYVVLMSFYSSYNCWDGMLLSHTFLILALNQLFKLRQNEDGREAVFNASLFVGAAASFHPPILIFLPFLFTMVWFIRPFVFKESLLILTGFIIPLIYGGLYLKYKGELLDLKLLKQTTDYNIQRINFLVTATLFSLLLIVGLLGVRARLNKSSIRFRKLVRILWTYFFLAIVFGVVEFIYFGQIERFSFLIIPLPFFLAYSFTHKSFSGVANILFYITLLYSFAKFFM